MNEFVQCGRHFAENEKFFWRQRGSNMSPQCLKKCFSKNKIGGANIKQKQAPGPYTNAQVQWELGDSLKVRKSNFRNI